MDMSFSLLFGLTICGFGSAFFCSIAWTLITKKRMNSWVEVPARIESLRLETEVDEDGDTHEIAHARYSYDFEGQSYFGKRVGLHPARYDYSDFQARKYKELRALHEKKTPTTCWVNPKRPKEAVLDRELRPGVLLLLAAAGLIFGIVGLGFWNSSP